MISDVPIFMSNSFEDEPSPSVADPLITGSIKQVVDAETLWYLARWAKTRGGLALADWSGPVWVDGGEVTRSSGAPNEVAIARVEAWPLEVIQQEERIARFTALDPAEVPDEMFQVMPFTYNLVAVVAGQPGRRISVFEVSPPSVVKRQTYMSVEPETELCVPLALVVMDGGAVSKIYDLRTPPHGWIYQEALPRTKFEDFIYRIDTDSDDDDLGIYQKRWKRLSDETQIVGYRILAYAPIDAMLEMSAHIDYLTWTSASIEDIDSITASLTFFVNGEPLVNGDLDRSMIEVVRNDASVVSPWKHPTKTVSLPGPSNNANVPYGIEGGLSFRPANSSITLRAVVRCKAHAIQNVELGVHKNAPLLDFKAPHLAVRVIPQPPFPSISNRSRST